MVLYSKKRAKRSKKYRRNKRKTYRSRGGQTPEKKTFYFYNKFHYGDHILNLKFFYNISNILKDNNILINYYYDVNYIKNIDELKRYVNSDLNVVTLLPLDRKSTRLNSSH